MIHLSKFFGMLSLTALLTFGGAFAGFAAPAGEVSEDLMAVVETEGTAIYAAEAEDSLVITQAAAGTAYKVTGQAADGWLKVSVEGTEGFVKPDGQISLVLSKDLAAEAGEAKNRAEQEANEALREQVVEYALSFVGNPYVYGGNDPNTGVDCSGFTRYVMENAAGVELSRTSVSQASEGRQVSVEDMKPGDLLFYNRGSGIGHVGIYIGNGQIVHASTEKTGIKVSTWNYKNPVRIVSVLG